MINLNEHLDTTFNEAASPVTVEVKKLITDARRDFSKAKDFYYDNKISEAKKSLRSANLTLTRAKAMCNEIPNDSAAWKDIGEIVAGAFIGLCGVAAIGLGTYLAATGKIGKDTVAREGVAKLGFGGLLLSVVGYSTTKSGVINLNELKKFKKDELDKLTKEGKDIKDKKKGVPATRKECMDMIENLINSCKQLMKDIEGTVIIESVEDIFDLIDEAYFAEEFDDELLVESTAKAQSRKIKKSDKMEATKAYMNSAISKYNHGDFNSAKSDIDAAIAGFKDIRKEVQNIDDDTVRNLNFRKFIGSLTTATITTGLTILDLYCRKRKGKNLISFGTLVGIIGAATTDISVFKSFVKNSARLNAASAEYEKYLKQNKEEKHIKDNKKKLAVVPETREAMIKSIDDSISLCTKYKGWIDDSIKMAKTIKDIDTSSIDFNDPSSVKRYIENNYIVPNFETLSSICKKYLKDMDHCKIYKMDEIWIADDEARYRLVEWYNPKYDECAYEGKTEQDKKYTEDLDKFEKASNMIIADCNAFFKKNGIPGCCERREQPDDASESVIMKFDINVMKAKAGGAK